MSVRSGSRQYLTNTGTMAGTATSVEAGHVRPPLSIQSMKTNARLTHDKVRFDEGKDLHLVLTLEAPRIDWQGRRPPICVIPVIDVSGSMDGEKLHYAKLSVMKLIDHLAPGDFCGVVTFTDEVQTIAPPLEMTQPRKDALKAAVGQLGPQGSTNFAGGLLTGLELAAKVNVPAGVVRRVIMFTDGLANVGVATKGPDLLRLLEANLGMATVSAFGYGADADQELLRDLSTKGRGNYAFVQNPEDAVTAFARELGGLLSTYARDIEVIIRPAPGAKLLDVVSDVDARDENGAVRIRIPDILSEEIRHLVLGLHVEPQGQPGRAPVALVEVRYQVVDGETARSREERVELRVEVERVPAGEEQREPTREVDEVVALAQLVRAQLEAEELARNSQFAAAQLVMHQLLLSLRSRGRDAAAVACERVTATVADGAAYADSDAFRTSMKAGVTRGSRGSKHAEAVKVLYQAAVQLSTPAQDAMADLFKEKGPAAPKRATASTRGGSAGKKSLTRRKSKKW